jgi:hypothetical protein
MNCPICETKIRRPHEVITVHEGLGEEGSETHVQLRLNCPQAKCRRVSFTYIELADFFPLETTNG